MDNQLLIYNFLNKTSSSYNRWYTVVLVNERRVGEMEGVGWSQIPGIQEYMQFVTIEWSFFFFFFR